MTTKQQKLLREALEAKLRMLTDPASKTQTLAVEQSADPIDDAQSKSLRELAVHVMNSDWQTYKAVEAALERIETGEYGLCENCEEPIHFRRLKALPWATRCVSCQEESEATLSVA